MIEKQEETFQTMEEMIASIANKEQPTYKDAMMVSIHAVNVHAKEIKALKSIVTMQDKRIKTLEALADIAQNPAPHQLMPRENFGS